VQLKTLGGVDAGQNLGGGLRDQAVPAVAS